MQRLFRTLIEHSLWIHYATLILVVVGILSVLNLRREARPPVNFDRLSVNAIYRGAAAEDIESLVVKLIEEKIDEVDGIEEYRSTSFEGLANITIKLDPDFSDKEKVVDDVQRAIDQINDFPESVEDPIVTEIKARNIPIVSVALYGDVDPLTLWDSADWLKDRLRYLEGVSKVDTEGFRDLQLKVETTPKKLSRFRISIQQIMSVIRQWNIDSPGGSLDDGEKDIPIRIQGQFREPEELLNLPIRTNDAGLGLYIRDVADVSLGLRDDNNEILFNGASAIILTVVKKENADTIDTVNQVNESLKRWKEEIPSKVNLISFNDDSKNIRSKLGIVRNNAVIGLTLVVITLILTLSTRVALITAIGLPLAFFGGLSVLWYMDYTINTLVVLGMIVVLGMLVDDAIVVAENIHYYLEKGHSAKESALRGVNEVWSAVTATVLTTMIAFFPLVFMKEIIGKFIRVMPIVVIAMLLFSLIEALFILPSHAADFLKPPKEKIKENGGGLFLRFRSLYERYIDWSIHHKLILFLCTVVYFGITFFVAKSNLNFVLFPAKGIEGLNIRFEAPPNTSLDRSTAIARELNQTLLPDLGRDIESMKSTVGEALVGGRFGIRQRGTHLSLTQVLFPEDQDFVEREKEVVAKVRKAVKDISEKYEVVANINVFRVGPPIGRPIQVEISGRDFSKTQVVAQKISDFVNDLEGASDIQSDLQALNEEYRLVINQKRAIESGLSLRTIAETLFSAFDGIPASETRRGNEEVEIIVTFPKRIRDSKKNVMALPILNDVGQYVPLSAVANLESQVGRNAIQRLNGQGTITVFGDVDEVNLTSPIANTQIGAFIEKEIKENFPDIRIELGGEEKDRITAVQDTMKLYLLAIFGIFIIISLTFESISFPIFVLLTIPFGLSGVVWALFIHSTPLTMMGLIGIVGLSGVVVNSSIIFIQFVVNELKTGKNLEEAVKEAASRRLRPILLTNITTLTGLIPAIYGFGGIDTLVQPLALTLGWGLAIATILIVLVLPSTIISLKFLIPKNVRTNGITSPS